jgi:dephospho-CoA kinase
MSTSVIAVVGLCGTGKSVVTEYSAREHGYGVIYFGGIVIDELRSRGLEVNPDNERVVREELRVNEGMAVMATRSLPEIHARLDRGERVVIDGLYSYAEYVVLRKDLADLLTVIAVHAPKYLRYERMGTRPVRPLTPEQVDRRDLMEIANLEKSDPIVLADEHLVNSADLDYLHTQIEAILTR